jgi:hypothetical protein|tara:strand:- start:1458 stop:1715 length:258 start_codon:yes stop_codon:yes gene_type:complete
MYYMTPEESARQSAQAAQVGAEFKAEFAAMMKKYQCEMSVSTSSHGYSESVDGVEFEFSGIYENGETVRPYFSVNVGTWANGDNV